MSNKQEKQQINVKQLSQTSKAVPAYKESWGENLLVSPSKINTVIEEARRGKLDELHSLIDDMIEKDPHLRSQLQTRWLSLQALEVDVEHPITEETEHTKAQIEAVERLVAKPIFKEMLADLTDAILKGYCVVEMVWGLVGDLQMPLEYIYRDQRAFSFDKETKRYLVYKPKKEDDKTKPKRIDLELGRFLIHRPKLKPGHSFRAGLGVTVAWYYLFKNISMKDWVNYIEKFAQPIIMGKYNPSASEEEKSTLLRAI